MDAYALDVGCDLYGSKVNVELKFQNGLPSLNEVVATIETEFDTRARATRPAGYPDSPFKIETVQVFDESVMRWVDLYDARQLKHKAQLWCFQPESIWHSDAQGVIPDPERKVCTFTTPLGSPRRARVATDAGVPPTLSEKLRSVFYQIDGNNKKYILYDDLARAFQMCDMAFTYATAGDLFQMADSNRTQHITYDEWVNFAIKAPNLIDALFFRFRDMQNVAPQPNYGSPSRGPMQSVPMQVQPSYSPPQPNYSQIAANAQRAEEDARRAEEDARSAAAQASQLQQAAQAAEQAAQQAAARHQQSLEAARQAQQQSMAVQRQSQSPGYGYGSPQQPSGYGQTSPQREHALREYEAARRRADEIRMAKEEAEREERNAWDRCYYSPGGAGSPQPPRY